MDKIYDPVPLDNKLSTTRSHSDSTTFSQAIPDTHLA